MTRSLPFVLGVIALTSVLTISPARAAHPALIKLGSGAAMCGALTASDFAKAGIQVAYTTPHVSVGDDGASAYCSYTARSSAMGGVEFDIFATDDPAGTIRNINGDLKGAMSAIRLNGADEAQLGTSVTSGGPPFATITVHRGRLVFDIGVPPSPRATAQLMELSKLVLHRVSP